MMNAVAKPEVFAAAVLEHPVMLQGLRIGDLVHTEGMLQGVSNEPLVWALVERPANNTEFIFRVTYYDAYLGHFAAIVRGDKVVIEEL